MRTRVRISQVVNFGHKFFFFFLFLLHLHFGFSWTYVTRKVGQLFTVEKKQYPNCTAYLLLNKFYDHCNKHNGRLSWGDWCSLNTFLVLICFSLFVCFGSMVSPTVISLMVVVLVFLCLVSCFGIAIGFIRNIFQVFLCMIFDVHLLSYFIL